MNTKLFSVPKAARERMNNSIMALRHKGLIPPAIIVQVSGRCNLRCTMCVHPEEKDNTGHMDLPLFRHLLDEMEATGIKPLYFAGAWGEPFLHPQIFTFLEEAVARKFRVTISTNMTPLTEEKMRKLAGMDLETVQLSYSGYDKNTYESVYVRGKFTQAGFVLRRFKQLLNEQVGAHPKVFINGCVMSGDEREAELSYLFLKNLGYLDKEINIQLPCNHAGRITNGPEDPRTGVASAKEMELSDLRLCSVLQDSWGILYDGRVTACGCLDRTGEMVFGDIRTQSFGEIAKDPRYVTFLEAFRNFNLEGLPCEKCDIPYGSDRMVNLFPNHKIEVIEKERITAAFPDQEIALLPASAEAVRLFDGWPAEDKHRVHLADNFRSGEFHEEKVIYHPADLSGLGIQRILLVSPLHERELLHQLFELSYPDHAIKIVAHAIARNPHDPQP